MDKIDQATGKVDRITFSRSELQKATRLVQAEELTAGGKTSFADKFPPKAEGTIAAQIISSKTAGPASNLKLSTAKQALEGLDRSK